MAKSKSASPLARLASRDARGKSAAERRKIVEAREKLAARGVQENPVRTHGGRVLTPESCTPLATAQEILAQRAEARAKHEKLPTGITNADGTRCTPKSASLAIQRGGEGETKASGWSFKQMLGMGR